jgi:glycosyltransferase involved in cell wall biosynthesis
MVLNPLISVILPVYNAEKFLKESLNSILGQSYTNLEIIIINDGSSDNSQSIINSYSDDRIIYIHQEQNMGLIPSLNNAIHSAKGDFIVRMDADDIAFKNRIQLQVQYLFENPSIAIVASHAMFFEEDINTSIPNWDLDLATNTPEEIKKALIWENCIIHPSVCMRTEIAKSLLYDPAQKNYEDYDFWLRVHANQLSIAKINEPLLYYRVQSNSITQTAIRKRNFFYQKAGVKLHFVLKSLSKGKINWFIGQVFLTIFADLVFGIGKSLKQMNSANKLNNKEAS